MRLDEIIEVDPEKMSGIPVFRGTRVPIKNLFDYLEGGDSARIRLLLPSAVTRAVVFERDFPREH